ncbi:VOC family protein [Neobacillus massiliamazoniensis]|uniref:Glyoxalase n=1 Tax=Neobacillus massiliamazoniensis TaxID=1499688 RepID=A0A0U1P3F4_9BACI|nr:VOC family protein [Neobacillus massiliamazoniensis]CRK84819.1 glyoxalase [Neobacillus massiliamazoniensis]
MRLNHLNLFVDDLSEARHFFETYFDFQFLEQKGKALVVLSDENGFILVLSDPKAFKGKKDIRYPEAFHIGFLVETSSEVDQAYDRLVAGGIEIDKEPYTLRGNSYGFYFTVFNGLLIEVSCIDYRDGKKVSKLNDTHL